jgi:hypothetical protein
MAASYEHGNEPLGSMKSREFLDQLSVLSASQGLYTKVLVTSRQGLPRWSNGYRGYHWISRFAGSNPAENDGFVRAI